jgi:hypothetical protein
MLASMFERFDLDASIEAAGRFFVLFQRRRRRPRITDLQKSIDGARSAFSMAESPPDAPESRLCSAHEGQHPFPF